MADAVELELKLRLTERELEEKTGLLESLQTTILTVTEQNNDLEEHNATLKKVQALLMERVAEAQREAEVFLKEKAEVSAENGRLHIAAKTLKRQTDELHAQLEDCQAQLQESQAEVEALQGQLASGASSATAPSPIRDRSASDGDVGSLPRATAGSEDGDASGAPAALSVLGGLPHLPGQVRRTPPGGDGHLASKEDGGGGGGRGSRAGSTESVDGDRAEVPQPANMEAYMEALSQAKHQLREQEMSYKLELDKLNAQLQEARATAATLSVPRDENGRHGSGSGSGGRVLSPSSTSSDASTDRHHHHHHRHHHNHMSHKHQHGAIISVSSGSGPYHHTHAKGGNATGGGGGAVDVRKGGGGGGGGDGFGSSLLSSLLWPLTELTHAVTGGPSKPRGFSKAHQVLQL